MKAYILTENEIDSAFSRARRELGHDHESMRGDEYHKDFIKTERFKILEKARKIISDLEGKLKK